jgi:hypothetical protein
VTVYTMAIRTIPLGSLDEFDQPEAIRLRQLLKFMLRAFGFRCMTIRPQTPEFSDGDGI